MLLHLSPFLLFSSPSLISILALVLPSSLFVYCMTIIITVVIKIMNDTVIVQLLPFLSLTSISLRRSPYDQMEAKLNQPLVSWRLHAVLATITPQMFDK